MLWGEEVSTGQNSACAGSRMTEFLRQGGQIVHWPGMGGHGCAYPWDIIR